MKCAEDPRAGQDTDPILDAAKHITAWVLGPDKLTRSRSASALLCAVMFVVCCTAARYAADFGIMRAWAPQWLMAVSLPVYVVFFALIRSGRTTHWQDPALGMTQSVYALMAITFAYASVGPHDRGVVLVLIALVIVFGMYNHTPKQSTVVGALATLMLALCMGTMSLIDPVYSPPKLELIRFEFLAGSLPPLVFCAHQLAVWRERLSTQRRELQVTLEKVHQLAVRDSLTGLYNRRHMQERLGQSASRFDRYGERFAVVLMDLDHFKRINDQHGHKVGDEVLTSFAAAASMVLRDTDTVGRWGGEEFLVVMPNTSADKALIAMDRLRRALQQHTVSASQPELVLGFSAGIAIHDAPGPLGQTLERADQALYQAKQSGRGRDIALPLGKKR